MMMTASIAAIHQGSPLSTRTRRGGRAASRLHHLDEQVQVGRVLFGDARDALDELPVDAGAELDRGAVRATTTVSPPATARRAASAGGELDLGRRPLEAELLDALDEGAREERPVTVQPQLAEEVLARPLGASSAALASAPAGGAT